MQLKSLFAICLAAVVCQPASAADDWFNQTRDYTSGRFLAGLTLVGAAAPQVPALLCGEVMSAADLRECTIVFSPKLTFAISTSPDADEESPRYKEAVAAFRASETVGGIYALGPTVLRNHSPEDERQFSMLCAAALIAVDQKTSPDAAMQRVSRAVARFKKGNGPVPPLAYEKGKPATVTVDGMYGAMNCSVEPFGRWPNRK